MPIVQLQAVPAFLHWVARQAPEPTTSSGATSGTTSSSVSTYTSGTSQMSTTMAGAPSSTSSASRTSDVPFFPSPTATVESNDSRLRFTKSAVEGALVAAAAVVVIALCVWRIVRLRRKQRPLTHFFRAHPQPDVPERPRSVPRTTGLPPVPAPPESLIYDTLSTPASLVHREPRRGRTRRTRAGDIDGGGRRGTIAHPDDPEEFLPEYDDKDVLPRYQDVQRDHAAALPPGSGLEGRSPNREGGTSDTIPLVTRIPLSSSATLEDGTSAPLSSGSHDCHEAPRPQQFT
ncbi:hypothetical protein C8T65DRAFT_663708 [Cerioporus squamosus]|nr:hypothetical protein C8T65DRAFT_663708 [Cerioporus squamosus]